MVISFDLQKVLATPFGENGDFYFVSILSTYNFTCYYLRAKQVYCFVCGHNVVKRGVCEVSSCKYLLLDDICKAHILFADNCPGQNQNCSIFNGQHLFNWVNPIRKGRTQNEKNSMHSRIEHIKKSSTVYHPGEWLSMAERACVMRPFRAKYLNKNFCGF